MSVEFNRSRIHEEYEMSPEITWQTVEYKAEDLVDDPRLSKAEQREFLQFTEWFGPGTIVRQHIPNRAGVAVVTEIVRPEKDNL